MIFPEETPLDNPLGFSLSQHHYNQAIDYCNVNSIYLIMPLVAFVNVQDTSHSIEKHAQLTEKFFIAGDRPKMPPHFNYPKLYIGLQMIIYNNTTHPKTEDIVELT